MSQPLAVVDARFCAPDSVQLRLKEKTSWSGDKFEIYHLPSKQPFFAIKGKTFSFRDEKTMLDAEGQAIATMRQPVFHLHPRMEVSGPGYSFTVTKKLKFIKNEAKAVVQDLHTKQEHAIYLCGHWLEHKLQIFLGKEKEGGRLLASAARQLTAGEVFLDRQTYDLTVMPGVDSALCVLLCIAFDEFWNEDN